MCFICEIIIITLLWKPVASMLRDFSACHMDFSLHPADGVLNRHTFSWLGFFTVEHVTTSQLHHTKAPRVVLVHPQFALGTAFDLLRFPRNYDLGRLIFGEYERVEIDCGLTQMQIKMGMFCGPAYIEMPVAEIIPHPEFSRFGVENSLALVKMLRPVKSPYMVPICLPSLDERTRQKTRKLVFLVDYISPVPKDFDIEKMAKRTLKLYTHRDCKRHRNQTGLGKEEISHILCTSGCGVRTGAPIVSHSTIGAIELIGMATSSASCTRKSQRDRLNRDPPMFIDVFPYTSWIIGTITGHILPFPYPDKGVLSNIGGQASSNFGYLRKRKQIKQGWTGRLFVKGNWCFKSERRKIKMAFFYSEQFEVNSSPSSQVAVTLEVSAGTGTTILCAQMMFPNRFVNPHIEGVGGSKITISFFTHWFPINFHYSIGIYGKNTTKQDLRDLRHEKEGYW